MKKLLLLALFIACNQLQAESLKHDLSFTQGYRKDSLEISYGRPNPHHLRFKDVDIYATRLGYSVSKDDYFLNMMAGYGAILNGRFSYAIPHDIFRHNSWHFKQKVSGNYTLDFQLAFGKKFTLPCNTTLSPKVGYSVSHTKLKMHHTHIESRSGHFVDKRRDHKVHGHYNATWYSPLIGLRAEKLIGALTLYADYTLLYPLSFRAHGGLKRGHPLFDIKDNTKSTRSFGNIGLLGFMYRLTDNWAFGAEGELTKYYTKGGHEHLDRKSPHRSSIRHVDRTTKEIRLCVEYLF